MDNKIVAIIAIVIVLAAGVGAAFVLTGDDDNSYDGVRYHGNGGVLDDGDSEYGSEMSEVSPNMFKNGALTFYKWNTKADGTGDFYTPGNASDYSKLTEKGVKDLYAFWSYTFTVSPVPSPDFTIGILHHGMIDDDQVYGLNPLALDKDNGSSHIVIIPQISGSSPVDWTFDKNAGGFTVTVHYSAFDYVLAFTDVKGLTDPAMFVTDDKKYAGVEFSYSGDVSLGLSINKVLPKVTYHMGDGTYSGQHDYETTNAGILPVNAEKAVFPGHVLIGWNTAADGSGDMYIPDLPNGHFSKELVSHFQASKVTDLYAFWTA